MTYVQNPLVPWILSHSYGQGGTVAVPSSDEPGLQVPRGEFPAGIDEVLGHLGTRHLNWTSAGGEVDWCFLVGGPGNGKSEALRTLAHKLGVKLPARVVGQPVPRVVPPAWPGVSEKLVSGLEVAFVNDASIPRADSHPSGKPGSLFLDIRDGLERVAAAVPVAILANVNRGILVEEASGLEGIAVTGDVEMAAAAMVRWLSDPPRASTPSGGAVTTTVPVNQFSPHYGQFRVTLPGGIATVVVHVIFLDVLSLLEPRPGGQTIDFLASPPAVSEYHTLGNLVSLDVTRDDTIAGKLIRDFVEPSRWQAGGCKDSNTGELCEAHATCPFAQNARWLQSVPLRTRFLDALRAAEVAAGRRLTYRDLLGHVSLAILGQPEDAWLKQKHPCEWSKDQREAMSAGDKRAPAALAVHRVYANLFAVGDDEKRSFAERERVETVYGVLRSRVARSGERPRVQAFEYAFRDIDPAGDVEAWGGMRGRVLDAVESLDVTLPSAEIGGWHELAPEAASEIEAQLDHSLREEIRVEMEDGRPPSTRRVRSLRRWRAGMLLRQVGLALGHFRFGTAIQAWLAEQENALRQGQRMNLGDGIHNLIIPPGPQGRVYLAPLRPRTDCLSGDLPTNTILVAVTRTDLAVEIVPQGDVLTAEVQVIRARERQAPLVLASLVIDLAVAREAILHASGNARSFTEIGYTAFSRIERARASLIGRERMKRMPILFTGQTDKVLKVIGNAGVVPLKVQAE